MVLEHSRKQPLMTPDTPVSVRGVLLLHWPVYLMEGVELGLFMLSACVFGTLLFYTGSPVVHRMPSPLGRVILMGLVMGVTAVAIIRSPFGARSSAHFNPIISFTFFCLGRMHWVDMFCYIAAQFIGAALGVLTAKLLIEPYLASPSVRYVSPFRADTERPMPSGRSCSWAF
jgi:aquaporin Z